MLENSLRDGILFRFQKSPDKVVALLNNYWKAVQERYPEAWDLPPRKSRLTHGVGIVSMGYLMDTIAYKLVRKGNVPSCEYFVQELKRLGRNLSWTEGSWNFSEQLILPWNEVQNTSRHIDLMANHLIRLYRNQVPRAN